jgi:nucleoside-diphosphate-sugar epimerase
MDKIIITGGTGFIGSHIVDVFIENGHTPVCLVRKDSHLDFLDREKVELVYGDIRDYDSLVHAFKGGDAVIHNAAYVRDWGDYRQFYITNVEGTLSVLQACVTNNIRRVIMTGTNSSYGEENCLQQKDESWPDNSHYPYFLDKIFPCKFNYYRDTKAVATQKAVAFAGENGLNLTILEPTWVYGEREFNTGFYEYLKTAKQGIPFMPGSKKNKFQVIYVQDLVRYYYQAYQKKLPGTHRILLCHNEAPYMNEIYSAFCRAAGCRKPGIIPKLFSYPIGFLWELLYTILRSKNPPLLTRGRVNLFYDNLEYNTEKAEKLLGTMPVHSLQESIAKTVHWYKNGEYL